MPFIILFILGIVLFMIIGAHLAIFLIVLGVIVFIAVMVHNSNKKIKKERGISESAIKINYYGGYNKTLSKMFYYWELDDTFFFDDPKTNTRIEVESNNILSFNTIGTRNETQKITGGAVKGGGVSLSGAVVGAAVAGPVGAVIGGRKKVKSEPIKSQTIVNDDRKVILRFKEHDIEKHMTLDYYLYNKLNDVCPSKNADVFQEHNIVSNDSSINIPEQIRKLSDLKKQGILTEEEFSSKKKDLLSKM